MAGETNLSELIKGMTPKPQNPKTPKPRGPDLNLKLYLYSKSCTEEMF